MLTPMNSVAQKIEEYKWRNRIVFLVDDSFDSVSLRQQQDLFREEEKAMLERDLILFLTDGKSVLDNNGNPLIIAIETLQSVARISPDFKGVVLLGKDGGYKLKKDFLIEPKEIFGLIDKMPMRLFEMANKLKIKY